MKWPDDFINKVICGDCMEILPMIPDGVIDAVVTDPPYGIQFTGKSFISLASGPVERSWASRGTTMTSKPKTTPSLYKTINPRCADCGRVVNGASTVKGYKVCDCENARRLAPWPNSASVRLHEWHMNWLLLCFWLQGNGKHLIAFSSSRLLHRLGCATEDSGYEIRDTLNWKHDAGVGRNNYSLRTVYEPAVVARKPLRPGDCPSKISDKPTIPNLVKLSKPSRLESNEHPTQKPVNVMRWILQHYSTPDDIILDPFAGSGTTLVAAKQLGRKYIGIEISPEYCKIAEDRLAQEELF